MRKMLLATSNNAKIKYFKAILKDFPLEIIELKTKGKLEIEEDLFDIKGNAIKKATTYAHKYKLASIADDTGFFIPALNNMPGVAVRRWGGELPDTISDEDWLRFFKEKISPLKGEELICIRKKIFCVALPNGKYKLINNELKGIIIKDIPSPLYERGGPLGAHFYVEKYNKLLSELIDEGLKEPEFQNALEKILKAFKII